MAALLVALAVLVLTARPSGDRLRVLHPPPKKPEAARLSPALTRSVVVLAAIAVWAVLGGVLGAVLGVAALVLGPRALAQLDSTEDEDVLVGRGLPLALDLLSACLTGGAIVVDAVRAVAAAVPGPCGDRLAMVAARLAVGSAPAQAWQSLGHDRGPAGAAARAMSRAAEGGAPVAAAVQRVADDARREAAGRAERAARRVGVLAVGPLGLCFLPAFLLLGVVPAVIGLATPLLTTL